MLNNSPTLSEKIIVMRHDVDSIWSVYEPGIKGRFKRYLNHLYIQLSPIRLRNVIPNYLENVLMTMDIEKDYNATATYFFRLPTAPTREIVRELLSKGHEIGYHSDRNYSFETFLHDLRLLEKLTGCRIVGFTKHGRSISRNGGPWSEKKFIDYGIRAGLKYLAQGVGHWDWEYPRSVRGLIVFGHHITLKRISKKLMKKYVKSRSLPLVLVHPEDISIRKVREMFEELLSLGKVVSVIEALKILGLI